MATRRHRHEGLRREVLVLPVCAQCGLLPGAITVESKDHLGAVGTPAGEHDACGRVSMIAQQAADDAHMLRPEGGTARGHRVRDARDVRGHHVRIALDDDHLVLRHDRLLRQI